MSEGLLKFGFGIVGIAAAGVIYMASGPAIQRTSKRHWHLKLRRQLQLLRCNLPSRLHQLPRPHHSFRLRRLNYLSRFRSLNRSLQYRRQNQTIFCGQNGR